MRLPVRALLAAALSLLISFTVLVPAATASTSYTPAAFASRLLQLLNSARQQQGLAPLTLATGTTTVAAGWTQQLAADQRLSHNPDLQAQLESHGSAAWTELGENVGDSDAQDPDGLWDAYMASPEHRDNVLTAKFRYVGNAVVFAGGRAWNTMDFVDAYASSKPAPKPAPSAASRVSPAPAPVAAAPVRTVAVPAHRQVQAAPVVKPRGTRSAVRQPVRVVTKPAVEAASAVAPKAVSDASAVLSATTPMDRQRVLALAIAAILALLLGGLWFGLALPTRR